MIPPADDFTTLLSRARLGDSAAATLLAQHYEQDLRIVATVQLGPALRPYLDSIDLVQSVHRSLLIGFRLNKFDISTPENLIALAVTMVRRKIARHWRHLQRQKRLGTGRSDSTELPRLLADLSSPDGDPARGAQMQDAVQHLWRHLDDFEKRLIELRMQGYSTAEVARELKLDSDVLRVRLSRLRQRLRTEGVLTEWL
jgi:RNA polymerase sigma-70 factor (ECF subfamily)